MKILIAPDSYKGSLSAKKVASAMAQGIYKVFTDAEVFEKPIADGGEGTVDALVSSSGGKLQPVVVTDPLGASVKAVYGILGDGKTAVIEMAAASGLPLVQVEKRTPMTTTTFGTGEIIKHALDAGCRKLLIGIGGSATNDGGVGMAQALGVSFLDQNGREVGYGGGQLEQIETIDMRGLDPRLKQCKIEIACDVSNPLCGPDGAAEVYGPQKGATKQMVKLLDQGLAHLAYKISEQLNIDIKDVPGAGAAGGCGAGLLAFLSAELKPGVKIILDAMGLEQLMNGIDLVLTGEGHTDGQTAYGKAPAGIASMAKKYDLPVICISGGLGLDSDLLYERGVDAMFDVTPHPMDLSEAMENTEQYIIKTTSAVMRTLRLATLGNR